MEVVRTVAELRTARAGLRGLVGFVPTMGALHEGHRSLLQAARLKADNLTLSIFVNPLQFGPAEDLALYPRTEEADLAMAADEGADLVFLPSLDEMYPPGSASRVTVGPLGDVLEGASRPGHFDGVATVVARLFNLIQPDAAFFGQKDAQQVAVIKLLTRDLGWPIEIVVCPTVRAEDGLALSSRNAYLSEPERARAVALWNALQAGAAAIRAGEDAPMVEGVMQESLAAAGEIRVEYARVVDPQTFAGWQGGHEALLVVAARVGETRLIDNLPVYRDQ